MSALFPLSLNRGLPARAILGIVVIAALLPSLVVGGWLANVSAEAERAQIEQNVQQRAHEISAILDRDIGGVKGMLIALATSSSLSNGNLRGFYAKSSEISQQLGVQIILYDVQDNRQILNTNVPFGTPLDAYSYPRALVDRVINTNGPFVTGVLMDPVVKRHAVSVILPLRSSDDKQHLLSAGIFASQMPNVFELVKLQQPFVATVVDRNGLIVARSSKHDQFVGRPVPGNRLAPQSGERGTLEAANAEGVGFRWFYERSTVTDWTVLVGAPEEMFEGSSRAIAQLMAATAIVLLVIGMAVAYFVGGGFSRAVSELGNAARELPRQPPPRVSSNIREANKLLDDLKAASADLLATHAQQRFAIDAAEIGIWSWDVAQNRLIWSPRTRELCRLPANAEPSVEHLLNSVHPADRDFVRDSVRRCREGTEGYEIEFRLLEADGESVRWINSKGRAERNTAGEVVLVHGALQDVTGRRQVELERAALRRRLMRAQEEERLRLAHELHDQTGQSLSAALLAVKQISRSVGEEGEVHLLQLREQLEDMGKTIHRIARELRPMALDEIGLRAALANHLSEWGAKYGIASDFHFHCTNDEDALNLPDTVKTVIYRIAQEALTNIVKHAKGATGVSLVVSCGRDLIQMTIDDNGCGFDISTVSEKSGLGIAGMRERATLVGGNFQIESSRRTGTTIFVRVPLEDRRRAA